VELPRPLDLATLLAVPDADPGDLIQAVEEILAECGPLKPEALAPFLEQRGFDLGEGPADFVADELYDSEGDAVVPCWMTAGRIGRACLPAECSRIG
jgi:hypothetical protein